jgi:hypothetical protein
VLTSESEYLSFISFSNLPKSLFIFPSSKSVIIVGGDFNLRHMDWETLSVFPGKPNQKQHQQFRNIIIWMWSIIRTYLTFSCI